MDILSITAADPAQTAVHVATPDGVVHVSWPCTTWHREAITAWLTGEGHAIAPWAPPPFDRAAARGLAIARLDALSALVTRRYPAAEIASWPIKDREARALLGGGPAEASTVVAPLAAALGLPVLALSAAIVAKADAYTDLALFIETARAHLDAGLADPDDAAAAAALATFEAAVEDREAAIMAAG